MRRLTSLLLTTTLLPSAFLLLPFPSPPPLLAQTTPSAEADQLFQQGYQLFQEGSADSLRQAIPLFEKASQLYQAAGKQDEAATALLGIGFIYSALGDKQQALTFYNQALPLSRAVGDRSGEATTLNNIGRVYNDLGDKQQALTFYNQALPLRRAVGDRNGEAATLNNIGLVYSALGDQQQALTFYNQALPLWRAVGDRSGEANTLNNIGLVYSALGDQQQALTFYNQALPLWRAVGDRSGEASTLHNIGAVYSALGDQQQALTFYNQALPLWRAVGDRSGEATTLHNIGAVYADLGDKQQALTFYNQALPLSRAVGDRSGEATTLSNIGAVYSALGDKQQALTFYNQALPLSRAVGNRSGEARTLNNIGRVYNDLGDKQQALTFYNQALPLLRAVGDRFGEASILGNLATVYQAQDNYEQAVLFLSQGVAVEEQNLGVNLAIGSEPQKRDYIRTISSTTDYAISLNLQGAPQNIQAGRLALTVILQRKGRILDVLGQSLQAIRQSLDPQDKKLLDDLTAVRSQLATLVYRGVGSTDPAVYRQQIQALEAKSNQLEADLNNRSASFRQVSQPVTIEAIQTLIPQNAALVEFVVYRPFNPAPSNSPARGGEPESGLLIRSGKSDPGSSVPREGFTPPPRAGGLGGESNLLAQREAGREIWSQPRYAAYVLRSSGDPQWVDLGNAAEIDAATIQLRAMLTNESETLEAVKQVSRQVDALLMQPIRPLLGDSTTLLLSPDGQLNLIPFGALVDDQGRWLLETHTIVYLSSGRDLLRFQEPIASRQPPLVIANPDYDLKTQVASASGQGQRSVDLATLTFRDLPFTKPEGEAIARLLPQAKLLLGDRASEAAITQVQGASVLHIATHGFFLPDRPEARGDDRSGAPTSPVSTENPLVRSGLALAGANLRRGDGGDGVLTALEVTALNLLGTKLVVLSACDTGKGAVANGEGVYGLRRAFVLAGAESLVMTLWSVDDQATQELMIAYYKNLQQGKSRAEALRQVQLAMLNSDDYWHPVYWAAFMPSGQWAPMAF